MTRLCFLVRRLERGGAERQLVELLRRLPPAEFDVMVLSFYPGGALAEELGDARHVRLVSLDKKGRWDLLPFLWRSVRTLRQQRPDVLHGWLGMANLVALLAGRLSGARVVWGVRSAYMDLSRYGWLERLEYALAAGCARFADAVVFNSWAGKAHNEQQGYRCRRAFVVPNGIDVERFAPDPRARASVRQEWQVADATRVVGLVARLDPMKDHETFLQAAASVASVRDDVVFVCVGGGPQREFDRLRGLADGLGMGPRVRWEGECDDVRGVYNGCDLVVLSSYGEGFPNVLGEALACGTPCVTTAVGDAAHLVTNPGYVVAARSPSALAAAILGALAAGRPDRSAVRRGVVERFSVDRMVEAYARLITEVAGRRAAIQGPPGAE